MLISKVLEETCYTFLRRWIWSRSFSIYHSMIHDGSFTYGMFIYVYHSINHWMHKTQVPPCNSHDKILAGFRWRLRACDPPPCIPIRTESPHLWYIWVLCGFSKHEIRCTGRFPMAISHGFPIVSWGFSYVFPMFQGFFKPNKAPSCESSHSRWAPANLISYKFIPARLRRYGELGKSGISEVSLGGSRTKNNWFCNYR